MRRTLCIGSLAVATAPACSMSSNHMTIESYLSEKQPKVPCEPKGAASHASFSVNGSPAVRALGIVL